MLKQSQEVFVTLRFSSSYGSFQLFHQTAATSQLFRDCCPIRIPFDFARAMFSKDLCVCIKYCVALVANRWISHLEPAVITLCEFIEIRHLSIPLMMILL
ncbi:hypothetical protein ACP275_03G091700 [Erythranthe tilingii]